MSTQESPQDEVVINIGMGPVLQPDGSYIVGAGAYGDGIMGSGSIVVRKGDKHYDAVLEGVEYIKALRPQLLPDGSFSVVAIHEHSGADIEAPRVIITKKDRELYREAMEEYTTLAQEKKRLGY